jgi:hypothetical protein
VYVPAVVGLPDNTQFDSVTPGGRFDGGVISEHVNGATPPVTDAEKSKE